MSLITGNCPICQAAIKPADNQAQFNRNRGLHLRTAHDQPGVRSKYIPVSQRPGHPKYSDVGAVLESKQNEKARREAANALRRKRYQEQYRLRKKQEKQTTNGSETLMAKLSECPCCGARFYYVKGK